MEAQILIERSRDSTIGKKRELLSISEMVERKWPEAKIRSIVSRGGGIPDEDAPDVEACMRFWVVTSTSQLDEDKSSQKASMAMQAQVDSGFVDGLFGSSMEAAAGQGSMAPGALNELMASTSGQPALLAPAGHLGPTSQSHTHKYPHTHMCLYECIYVYDCIRIHYSIHSYIHPSIPSILHTYAHTILLKYIFYYIILSYNKKLILSMCFKI